MLMANQHDTYNQAGPLRWIASHVFRYKVYSLLFLICAILAQVFAGFIPVVIGWVFTEAQMSNPAPAVIVQSIGIAALMIMMKFAADMATNFAIEIIAQRVKRDARDELYQNLLAKQQSFHNRQQVGDLMARAINDARLIDYMLSPGVAFAFTALMALLIPILFISFFRIDLLLAPLIFLLLFGLTIRSYIRKLLPVTVDLRQQFSQLNAGITETIAGINVVKWSAQEQSEVAKFIQNANRYCTTLIRRGRAQALYLPTLCLGVAMAIGAIHALYLMANHQITLGNAITYLGWLGLFHFPTTISESSILVIQEGYVGATRMLNLIKEEMATLDDQAGQARVMQGRVIFENVCFAYDQKPTLQNISFQAEAGQTIAIVGPTGSGKTTLTKLINRTYTPCSGKITIDGLDVQAWSLKALRSQIGKVEQDVFLFSKSIAANIAFGSDKAVNAAMLETVARQAQAHAFIQELPDGYETVLSEGGATLSGGQRQRLVIARALMTDPKILILDDATSAVDSDTEEKIQRAIQTVMQGRTTFLITHRLSQIRQADKILVMVHGTVIDQGTHEELIGRCGFYRRIYSRTEEKLDEQMADS